MIMPLTAAWFCHSGHANSSRRGRGLEARTAFCPRLLQNEGRRCEGRVCPHGPVSALQLSSHHCRLFPHLFWISPLSSLHTPTPHPPPLVFQMEFLYWAWMWSSRERPHDKLSELFALYKRHRMPADHILNLLLILNLASQTM